MIAILKIAGFSYSLFTYYKRIWYDNNILQSYFRLSLQHKLICCFWKLVSVSFMFIIMGIEISSSFYILGKCLRLEAAWLTYWLLSRKHQREHPSYSKLDIPVESKQSILALSQYESGLSAMLSFNFVGMFTKTME